jgi:mevalonate kinase
LTARYQVGSKAFVLGEYSALRQGPALLLSMPPWFRLESGVDLPIDYHGVAKEDPAYLYYQAHRQEFSQAMIFEDVHAGLGGFGASSAAFALLLQAKTQRKLGLELALESWQIYRDCHTHLPGVLPSGYDLIAQQMGGLVFIEMAKMEVQSLSWPWRDVELLFVHTGTKVKTHQHLAALNSDLDFSDLAAGVYQAKEAILQGSLPDFAKALQQYHAALKAKGLVAAHSDRLQQQLQEWEGVLAVKGCGALAADLLCLLVRSEKVAALEKVLRSKFPAVIHVDLN